MTDRPQSPDRLVFFSDAVVAIALTLLVLPLVDVVPALLEEHRPAAEAITENGWRIIAFLLSFVVIARQWLSHHHLFERIRSLNRALIWLNIAWLLTIAVLPFPTELAGAYGDDRFAVLFYIGTVFANTLCLMVMTLLVRRDPELARDTSAITPRWVFNSVGAVIVLIAAFLLSALAPAVGSTRCSFAWFRRKWLGSATAELGATRHSVCLILRG